MPKLTLQLQQEIIAFCTLALARLCTKTEIHRLVKDRYNLGHRQADNYLTRARGVMLAQTGKPMAEHKADAYEYYKGIIKSSTIGDREKLIARERLDKLLGLEVYNFHHSGGVGAGGPIFDRDLVEQLDPETLELFARIEDRLASRMAPAKIVEMIGESKELVQIGGTNGNGHNGHAGNGNGQPPEATEVSVSG